jgi:hypothetical protein
MPSFWLEEKDCDVILHNKYGQYSRVEIENQLQKGKLTVEELGSIYSLNVSRIVHILRLLKISHRNKLSDTRIPNFDITPSMHQTILGTLLGDAFMKIPNSYMLSHSVNQMDYLYATAEKLGNTVSTVQYKKTDLGKSLNFWTNSHEKFEPYFKRFYSHGRHKKYIQKESVFDLEPEGLAFWYMDDGKFHEYGIYLCTGKISTEEAIVLRDLLDNKFNLKTTLQTHDLKKDYHYIYIKAESRSQFFSLIKPYIIPSMQYKITGDAYPTVSENLIAYRHLEYCEKVERPVRFSGNLDIEKIIEEKQKISAKKIQYMDLIRDQIKNKTQVSLTQIRKEPSERDLKELFEKGLSDQEIADKYGFGRNRISHLRRALNVSKKSVRKKINKDLFPCLNVRLVSTDMIISNEYNPNKVATPEMELLIHSIEEDGVTQPIVVFFDEEKNQYVVIDGFHRYTVLKNHFKCEKIPVVILNKSISERMASTIRHNRARGKHQVDLMGILIKNLADQGLTDEQIAHHLGMEGEELLRLRQQVGCAKVLANSEYSQAWEIK